jgi:hypothetical protein
MASFWRVASYGYPNPFGGANERRSWEIFKSFADRASYADVKSYWASRSRGKLSAHAVESRKSSLEEFGLLYVLTATDQVVITPAGHQLLQAADTDDQQQFAWIGINLLMRFPLQGPPRARVTSNVSSDFPIYNFIYSAFAELQNVIWFEELVRVLAGVTNIAAAQAAIEKIRELRAGTDNFDSYPPMPDLEGAYYNSMNQVINHVGLGGLIVDSARGGSPYANSSLDRKNILRSSFSELVRLAIGQHGDEAQIGDDCVVVDQFIGRMPTVPIFNDELSYFRYLGAAVPDLEEARGQVQKSLPQVLFGQENVSVLTESVHYALEGTTIAGQVAVLCRIARGQRLILSHDTEWTYKVRDKARVDDGRIAISISRSKPISSPEALQPYFERDEDERLDG